MLSTYPYQCLVPVPEEELFECMSTDVLCTFRSKDDISKSTREDTAAEKL